MNNIILYGGSFDPLHIGHVHFVETLIKSYPHSEIWVLPSVNWLKNIGIFSINERILMCEQVFKDYPTVKVINWSLFEDTSSTYIVSNKIKNLNNKLTIALGEDNLDTIEKWSNAESLIFENNFIILTRPSCHLLENPPNQLAQQLIKKSIIINFEEQNISSTNIRNNPDKYIEFIPLSIKDFCKRKLINEK